MGRSPRANCRPAPSNHGRVVVEGLASLLDELRLTPDRLGRDRPRHDRRHQRDPRAQGRAHRSADHARLPRRAGDPPHPQPRALQPAVREAAAARAAAASAGGGRAHRPPGPGRARSWTWTRPSGRRGSWLEPGIESLAICFLNAYANPDHEQRVGELARRGVLRLGHLAVFGRPARDPRVRAHVAPPSSTPT